MRLYINSKWLFGCLALLFSSQSFSQAPVPPETYACPPAKESLKEFSRSDVYKDSPYKAGEISVFEASWSGILAGYANIEIQSPQKHQGIWHRVFHIEGKTGDWFKGIFVAHDVATSLVRPQDSAVSKFYIEQREGTMFGKPFIQKKWLEFNHATCKVSEKEWRPEKGESITERDVHRGAVDAIGAALKLRTIKYEIGKPVKYLVYTSEKNWFLEATPVAIEDVKVPAGTFKATKVKLLTFIGKDLQQKGDVFAWIATDAPHAIVQIEGQIKIGSVLLKLSKFTPGT